MWAHLGPADPRSDGSEQDSGRSDMAGADRRLVVVALLAAALALAASFGFAPAPSASDTASPAHYAIDRR